MSNHCQRAVRFIPWILGGMALAVGFAFLFGFFVMLLWNWLMPTIFGLGSINYWQAWGLVLLSHLLIKAGGRHPDHNHHDEYWKKKFRSKFWEHRQQSETEPTSSTADSEG
jgi:hypothetical protein